MKHTYNVKVTRWQAIGEAGSVYEVPVAAKSVQDAVRFVRKLYPTAIMWECSWYTETRQVPR